MPRKLSKLTDDDWNADGTLRDKHSFRTPLMMADSNNTRRRTLDAAAFRPGFRGVTTLDDTTGDAAGDAADRAERRQLMYEMYDHEVQNAYKNPGHTADYFDTYDAVRGDGETDPISGAHVGDLCTVRSGAGQYGAEGSPGHMVMIENVGLTCVADTVRTSAFAEVDAKTFASAHNRTASRDSGDALLRHRQTMNELYAARDAELRDAWRNPK